MCKNRKYYAIMANRKMLWLASVVAIALGLIFNIVLGTRTDIRFTGGTVLRYSYPESGVVSIADVPAMAVPTEPSGSDVQNTEPKPAELPVIISDADVPGQLISGTDAQESTSTDVPENAVSDSQTGESVTTGSDAASGTDVTDTILQPDYSTAVDPGEASRIISEVLGEEVTVAVSTDADSPTGGENKRLTVTLTQGKTPDQDADALIRQAMEEKYPNVALTLRESNLVDPAVGVEFLIRCVIAVGLSALFIMLYMGFRYRSIGGWSAGLSALIGIAHDCLIAYFAFVLFGFTIDDHFIAVVLAIIGLSINSTMVIFDRIRENRALLRGSLSITEIADRSVNETMGRTVSTDLCVFIAMAVLAAVSAIYGVRSMLGFALPMMFGVAAGCYSSLCISCTLWVTWQERVSARLENA